MQSLESTKRIAEANQSIELDHSTEGVPCPIPLAVQAEIIPFDLLALTSIIQLSCSTGFATRKDNVAGILNYGTFTVKRRACDMDCLNPHF